MRLKERIFFGAGLLVIVLMTVAGGYLGQGGIGAGFGPASPRTAGSTEIQKNYEEALDIVSEHYAGTYDIEAVNKRSILGLLRTLDPHSSYFDSREFTELRNEQQSQLIGIGVQINFRNDRIYILSAIPDTPAEKAGLRYGDAIVAVDGKSTEDWSMSQVLESVRGERGKPVEITVDRVGSPEPVTVRIVRESVPLPSIRNHFMVNQNVGYVGLVGGFSSTTDAELARAVSDLKAQGMQQLVLDMRRNPGGLLDEAVKVAERFLPAGQKVLVVRGRNEGTRKERTFVSNNDRPETLPLVILIDGSTASASEVVTGALQDHDRALVVGERSFGKGLVQSVFDLDFGTGLTLTTAKYYTPTGRSIQRDYAHTSIYDYYLNRTDTVANGEEPQGEALLTDLGRRVYGGGGISPDIKVEPAERSPVRNRLFGATFEFARHLVAGEFPELREYKITTVDFDHRFTGSEYPISDKVIEAFRRFIAERSEFTVTRAQLDANLDYVRNRIREEVITAAYGTDAGNQFYMLNDVVMVRAIDSLPQARELAENARAVGDRR